MSKMKRFSLAAALGALLAGCDSVSPADASFDIDLETAHTVAQGDIVEIPVSIQRSNFEGPITFSVQQPQAGLSASFSPAIVTGTETKLTLTTTGAASPGAAEVTFTAKGDGAPTVSGTLTATIHLRGSYTLELLGSEVTVMQGGQGFAEVILRRSNANASAVSLNISGLPAGVTTSPSTTTTGPGTSISFTATAGATVGTHTITITSTAAGTPTQSASLSLVIIAPPAGMSVVSLPFCPFVPIWFAYRNEGDGWRRVMPSGNTFSFIATERVAIAMAFARTNNGSELMVQYVTRQELALRQRDCQSGKTITGSVSGLGGQRAYVEYDNLRTQATSSSPGFTLTGVRGNYDLVASRGNLFDGVGFRPDRFILRRGLNPAAGSALPTLDFGTEGFDPGKSALAVSGLSADEDLNWAVYFIAANVSWILLHDGYNDPTPTTTHAFPTSALQSGDIQVLVVSGTTIAPQGYHMKERVQYEFFGSPLDHSVSLPPAMPDPKIELVALAPYPRLRVQIASQPEYDAVAEIMMWNAEYNRDIYLAVSAAYLGGTPTTWDLVVPDFGDLAALGFNAAWAFPSVVEYYAYVHSHQAGYWDARPTAGEVWRVASDLRDFVTQGAGGAAALAARAAPLHERSRSLKSQVSGRPRLR